MPDRTYRCLDCLEYTLVRPFDVSHLSITCPVCGEFQRFVNDDVLDQYQAFQDDPPETLDWERLERTEKLMISDQIVRTSRTVEDFSVEDGDRDTDTDPQTPDDDSGDGCEPESVDDGT